MKLLLSDAEQKIIKELFEDIHSSGSLEEFLNNYIVSISSLIQAEYRALMMFACETFQHQLTIDNNPDTFNKAYSNELVFRDQFLDHLISSTDNHHFLSRYSAGNPSVNGFIGDCNSLRPTGDAYYGTLRFRGRILGMTGFTLPRKNAVFEERQRQILSLVRPVLDNGILTHLMRDKVALMGDLSHSTVDFSYFFVYNSDQSIEVPGEADPLLIEQILGLRSGDPAAKNLFLSRLLERFNGLPYFHSNLYDTLYRGDVPYTLRLFRRSCRQEQKAHTAIILATIEKDRESYAYNSFAQTFSLTRREGDVLRQIIRGLSNKQISERLFISQATVKKHISNIFEKTGTHSRTQLLFALSSVSGC